MSVCETESLSPVAPARLFKALSLEACTVIPKALPHAIKSVKILEGDGGPGTIGETTFAEGAECKSMKTRIDAVDTEKLKYGYTVIEGEVLQDILEKISFDLEFLPGSDGGSIVKTKSRHYYRGETQLSEDRIKENREKGRGMLKMVEKYLLENPEVCT